MLRMPTRASLLRAALAQLVNAFAQVIANDSDIGSDSQCLWYQFLWHRRDACIALLALLGVFLSVGHLAVSRG